MSETTVETNRAAINHANSQKSTGPKTETGKSKTRFNAFRHGLTGKTVVMPWQDQAEHQAFCAKLFTSLRPEGALEEQYAQTVADCSWRLNSAAAREANLLTLAIQERAQSIQSGSEEVDAALAEAQALREESHVLANISLYCQRIARQRDKAFEQLRALQQERRRQSQAGIQQAAQVRKLHIREHIPFEPAEYGFVFSTPEIDAYIHRESRLSQALRAAA